MVFQSKRLLMFFIYRRELHLSFLKKCESKYRDKSHKKLKILFFGTDNFSLPTLKMLHAENGHEYLGVATSFKNPANCVRIYAKDNNLPLWCWPVPFDICKKFDLGVVVSFGHLIPEDIINAFPLGMLNVHASLLPRWRGAAPIIYAILNNDTKTGVSIMKIEPRHFDIGDIFAQKEIRIDENVRLPDLQTTLAIEGATLLNEVIKGYPQSLKKNIKQDNVLATYAPKITFRDAQVDWVEMSAMDIYRRFRALYSFKCLRTYYAGRNILLVDIKMPTRAMPLAIEKTIDCGSFVYLKDCKCLVVRCRENSFIEVHQLRVEGKKVMSAMEFNNGFLKNLKMKNLSFLNKAPINFY